MTSLQEDRANKQRGDARCTKTIVMDPNTSSTVTCDDNNQQHIKIQLRPNLGDLMQRYKNSIPQAAKHNGPASAKEVVVTKRRRRGVSSQRHRAQLKQTSEDSSVKIVRIERVNVHGASCNTNTVSPMSINRSLLGNTQERKKLVLKLRELLRLQYPDHQSTNPNAIFVKARDCLNQTGKLPSKICGLTESLDTVLTCVHYYAVFGGTFESARPTPVN